MDVNTLNVVLPASKWRLQFLFFEIFQENVLGGKGEIFVLSFGELE